VGAPAPRRTKRQDAKAVLAAAKLPERSVELCLRGDLVARLQELQRELTDADREEKVGGSLAGGESVRISEEIRTLREEMLDHTMVVRLRALPRKSKAKLIADHPPREDHETDRLVGFNEETTTAALLRACAFEPALDEDDWARLEDVLSDGQWVALNNAVWSVNTQDVDIPFSRRASQILASSAPE
jgi:hypothetical protein